jgi:hypothetical protein
MVLPRRSAAKSPWSIFCDVVHLAKRTEAFPSSLKSGHAFPTRRIVEGTSQPLQTCVRSPLQQMDVHKMSTANPKASDNFFSPVRAVRREHAWTVDFTTRLLPTVCVHSSSLDDKTARWNWERTSLGLMFSLRAEQLLPRQHRLSHSRYPPNTTHFVPRVREHFLQDLQALCLQKL